MLEFYQENAKNNSMLKCKNIPEQPWNIQTHQQYILEISLNSQDNFDHDKTSLMVMSA